MKARAKAPPSPEQGAGHQDEDVVEEGEYAPETAREKRQEGDRHAVAAELKVDETQGAPGHLHGQVYGQVKEAEGQDDGVEVVRTG